MIVGVCKATLQGLPIPLRLMRTEREVHSDARRRTVVLVETVKHGDEDVIHDVQHLIVVLVDGHLKVQARELAQMPVCIRLLRPAKCIQASSYTGYADLQQDPGEYETQSYSSCRKEGALKGGVWPTRERISLSARHSHLHTFIVICGGVVT